VRSRDQTDEGYDAEADADVMATNANEGMMPKAGAKRNVGLRRSYVRHARIHMRQAVL